MAVIPRAVSDKGEVLRLGGAFTAAFSVVMALLVLFVLPSSCSFVGGLELVFLGFSLIIGVLTFFLGQALMWKNGARR